MSDGYWERCWKEENQTELYKFLDMYNGMKSREIDIFKEHNIEIVCDAACGFGAFSLAFASNGFRVHSFDISETAVKITANGLKKYGFDASCVKRASILNTGYADETFDGVIAHAVLDHLDAEGAKNALKELFRITSPGGLVILSFDTPEDGDFAEKHVVLDDGTMQYIGGPRDGMLFHPYDWEEIDNLLKGYDAIYRADSKKEKTVILKK